MLVLNPGLMRRLPVKAFPGLDILPPGPGAITLMATSQSRRASSAWYTTPMPPRPEFFAHVVARVFDVPLGSQAAQEALPIRANQGRGNWVGNGGDLNG